LNQTHSKGVRITYVMLGVSVAALIIAFIAVTVLAAWRARELTPRLAVDSMIKALRSHHKQTGRFPVDFRELEARVWKHKKSLDFGVDGRSLSITYYYYIYHQVDAHTVTIWIVPTGPRREEGSTHFLLLTPGSMRRWRGAPLSLGEVKDLPAVPHYQQMNLLGMIEQKAINLEKRRT
jgi:hypothetical protein